MEKVEGAITESIIILQINDVVEQTTYTYQQEIIMWFANR